MTPDEARAKILEHRRRDRSAMARAIRQIRATRHRDGAVLLQEKRNPEAVVFVSPRIGGGWRTTRFWRQEPVGHYEFDRFRDAVASLCGKFGSWGPPHGSHGQWIALREEERF